MSRRGDSTMRHHHTYTISIHHHHPCTIDIQIPWLARATVTRLHVYTFFN